MLHLFFQGSTDSLRQAGNTRDRVKSSVETQDLSDPILFHNGEMYSVTSRQLPISKNNLFCTFHCDTVHTQHFIDDSKQGIESRLDCVAAIYRHIAVQDLLQRFGIGHESLSAGNQLFKQPLCVGFMRVRRANKIHRNVGINQNHGRGPAVYPASISASMRSISPTVMLRSSIAPCVITWVMLPKAS